MEVFPEFTCVSEGTGSNATRAAVLHLIWSMISLDQDTYDNLVQEKYRRVKFDNQKSI